MDFYLCHLPGPDPGKYHIQFIVLYGYMISSVGWLCWYWHGLPEFLNLLSMGMWYHTGQAKSRN